jgi:hypothetical protein
MKIRHGFPVAAMALAAALSGCSSTHGSTDNADEASFSDCGTAHDVSFPAVGPAGGDADPSFDAEPEACDAASPDLAAFDGGLYSDCIPFLRQAYPTRLAACQAECGCAAFLVYCVGPAARFTSASGCLSAAQTPATLAIFYASTVYGSGAACSGSNYPEDAGEAGVADDAGDAGPSRDASSE